MKTEETYKAGMETMKALAQMMPIHAAVLNEGYRVLSEPLTEDELSALSDLVAITQRICPFERKQCFHNSQLLVLNWETGVNLDHPGVKLDYAEGFVLSPQFPEMPIHHGFILINDKLVDPTLRVEGHKSGFSGFPDRAVGDIPEGYVYLAMKLPNKDVVDRIQENMETLTLLDDWQNGFPYVKKYLKRY